MEWLVIGGASALGGLILALWVRYLFRPSYFREVVREAMEEVEKREN